MTIEMMPVYVERIAIFIMFLCPLVFFHELGHFIFARLFGVRVEVFSIGFGPKIFKWKRSETQYAFSAIPLGGYVKMYGDDPFTMENIPLDQRKYAYTYKTKRERFWVVFGGPLANFILAYILFFGLLFNGEEVPEIRLGVIEQNSLLYEKGFMSGDVINKVNGHGLIYPTDIAVDGTEIIQTMTIIRFGEEIKIPVNMSSKDFLFEFAKYPAFFISPIIFNEKGESYSLKVNGNEIPFELISFYAQLKNVNKVQLFDKNNNKIDEFESTNLRQQLIDKKYFTNDLVIKRSVKGYPAYSAGIEGGDLIYSLNEKRIYGFESFSERVQKLDSSPVDLKVIRNGKMINFKLTPIIEKRGDKDVKVFGISSAAIIVEPNRIKTPPKGFFGSLTGAFLETTKSSTKIFTGIKNLVTGKVSIKSVGGPVAIGKVASDYFHISLTYFFQIMALISVHLGMINLLPIPVLDGGHIMFIVCEIINKGPLSRKKMMMAQQFGLSLLLVLTFVALFNDFNNFF
ncbi:MAG: RIP metalloprotease RseP [Halobacteriovoraceae bacterium]|nr:RIP metalloprotease RseP [Halobacteriovoraceae bacterium]